LTGGKGVKVMGDHFKDLREAKEYVAEIFEKRIGSLAKVVVEERLEGEEFSLQAFTDGKRLLSTPCVQDHKRALEGDKGMNTGGMGSYSDKNHLLPFLTPQDLEESLEIMRRTIQAIKKEVGLPFKGILYGGFIATAKGPMILEFNARLGDPEAINILPLFQGDPLELLYGIAEGILSPRKAGFKEVATVCKYIVPKGYVDPSLPKTSEPIRVDEERIRRLGAEIFYASLNLVDGRLMTTTSRSLAVLGVAEDIYRAEELAERATHHVSGNLYHRRDIGTRRLVERRIHHMEEVRRARG
jgi:phosphoribosylamine--glycine ligase